MPGEKNSCPSCGSVNTDGAMFCDICGQDLSSPTIDVAARTDTDASVDTAATAGTGTASAAAFPAGTAARAVADASRVKPGAHSSARKKSAPKSTARAASSRDAALFTTWQWIAIVVAAFILGGVIGASFLPSAREGVPAEQEQSGTAQSAQPDLQSLEAAREAAEANPSDARAQLQYANLLHDAMMLDAAIAQYRKYLEMNSDDPDARVDLGICYFEKKEYTAAIAEMERAVANHPEHQLGTYNLGIVNLNAGNKDKAREWFSKARDIDPSSAHGRNAAQLLEQHL